MSQPANDDFSQHLSDDEASYHEDASENGTATNKPKQQQQLIPTTTTISNIKLPILKKEEYDIWAMEMEHYLEYIDNDVWKVIQNGNSKKRISTGKDGVVRILPPVSAAEIHAVEKERKARTILLMAIPKEHLRRFHGMDDAKEIWEAIRTRFGGNANSKKMQKAVLKQQFEAFTISSSEGLEKGYDRFQQLLSQLEAHGAEVSTEDANHKFLRSLPPAWSNLAMTMRTKPDVDTLSIDDLYNNLRVFEQELTSTSKSSASAQNIAFVSHSKSNTNKVKSGHTRAYSTCTPTSSNNFQEREVSVGFDKKKLECFKCHNTGHFGNTIVSTGLLAIVLQKAKQIQDFGPTSGIRASRGTLKEYDIWAMEMEHYLEYIDNDVWKVILNGNSKKRISTGKDGAVRILPPVSAAEIHAVEKERKARTILLMAIPKEHLRRFHGMDDAKEIWEAIRTRFGGNANSTKMQKAV
ncbi:hypothetical protein Tco_1338622 [Tanacetum coccineum]